MEKAIGLSTGKKLLVLLTILITGVAVGALIMYMISPLNMEATSYYETRESGYNYINPLLECAADQENAFISNRQLRLLQDNINGYVEQKNKMDISVYFRDLDNGPSFGINTDRKFSPASLLKVPVLITYLKAAEAVPELLTKTIRYEKQPEEKDQGIIPAQEAVDGQEYSITELLEFMIIYSDNGAALSLINNIDSSYISEVYDDFSIDMPTTDADNFMAVNEYASFFRILYNASYLNRKMSEKALEILAKSAYKAGLAAGVPENIRIAHKFGERSLFLNGRGTKQLHDCGIVYAENKHYLLCIMTRGDNADELSGVIKDISARVYADVEKKPSPAER